MEAQSNKITIDMKCILESFPVQHMILFSNPKYALDKYCMLESSVGNCKLG